MNRDLAIAPNGRPLSERIVAHRAGTTELHRHEAPSLDVPTLLRILREWKWLIIGVTALGLVGGLIATVLTTPLYRAFVTLEVNPPTVEISDEQQRERQQVNSWDFIATQVGLLGSRSLAERVAQDLNLANNPAFAGTGGSASDRLKAATGRVAGGLSVSPPEEGSLIRFSYTATDPNVAAQVANGIAESFINSNLQRRFESSAYARRFLERQIAKTRSDLERTEQQLVAYAQAQGIINLGSSVGPDGKTSGGDGSLQSDSLVALNQALAQATARRVAAEGAYRSALSSGPTSEVNTSTQALRQARAGLEAEYQDKLTLLKPDHPDMASLRNRITELDRQIARETSQVTGGRTNTLVQEYRSALSAERALQGRVGSLKGSVLDMRGRSVRYNILQREVDTNRGLYDALLQRYKEIGVAGGIGTTPVTIVDRAETPGGPFKPNMPYNLLAGLGAGLLAGVALAIGLEFLSDTIKTREDVRTKLQLACLGAIPKRAGKGSFVEDLKDPGSGVSEAYSTVAAGLRFSTADGVPRSLLITSTQAGEGKSSSALALAQNFARRGQTVLLIDSDLRKPSFKAASDEHGLTKLLTNHDEVAAHVLATQFENLWLVPCGPLPPNPADLLSTGRFGEIVAEASRQFDMVIIDAPPVLGLADAPLIASGVAGALFVVESGKTRTRAAVEALNRLEASGAHILGALLSKATERDGDYGYYRYRYGAIEEQTKERIVLIPHQGEA